MIVTKPMTECGQPLLYNTSLPPTRTLRLACRQSKKARLAVRHGNVVAKRMKRNVAKAVRMHKT